MTDIFTNEVPACGPRAASPLSRAAIIDVGSNSIRTMTARLERGACTFSAKTVHTTRLAEGLLQTGALSNARMEQSLSVICAFAADMHAQDLPVFAYATSAVRDANNRDAFSRAILECVDGLEVLSGEQEARYAFLAATNGVGGMLDIGGGSTQVVTQAVARSFPFGCVRAKDLCPAPSLAQLREALGARLNDVFDLDGVCADRWTGVGGTVTTLAALSAGCDTYDRDRVNRVVLEHDGLLILLRRLEALGDARAQLPLLKKRHDVILQGGVILLYLLDRLHVARLCVSDADGLEGYAMHLLGCGA